MDVTIRCRPPDPSLVGGGGAAFSQEVKDTSTSSSKGRATGAKGGSIAPRSLSEAAQAACASQAFDHKSTQTEVARAVVVPHLNRLIKSPGSAFVCIAYGQTGSGKTHSIFGPPGLLTEEVASEASSGGGGSSIPDAWGLFPRSLALILQELQASNTHAQMRLTAVEVYLERVYDLLNEREMLVVAGISAKATPDRLQMSAAYDENGKWKPPERWSASMEREEAKGKGGGAAARNTNTSSIGNNTNNAKEFVVASMQDIALAARTVEATRSAKSHSLNERSSRSHCLITVSLQQIRDDKVVTSHLVFADLAGSERVKESGVAVDSSGGARAFSLTNNIRVDIGGTRLDEAKSVNTSLSALGRVVAAMARNDKFISFRDSALTQLLKPALTSHASCRITVLLALRSEPQYANESLSTQRFGAVCANAAGAGGGAGRGNASMKAGGGGSSSKSTCASHSATAAASPSFSSSFSSSSSSSSPSTTSASTPSSSSSSASSLSSGRAADGHANAAAAGGYADAFADEGRTDAEGEEAKGMDVSERSSSEEKEEEGGDRTTRTHAHLHSHPHPYARGFPAGRPYAEMIGSVHRPYCLALSNAHSAEGVDSDTHGGKAKGSSGSNSGSGVKVSSALAAANAQLAVAEADIAKMQAEGLDEHTVKPCAEFPQATINGFLENKRQFEESAVEARRWKHQLLELQAQAKRGGGDAAAELRVAKERLAAAEHSVFVYSGMFYRQCSTGLWVPRHKRLVARMNDRERLRMQIAFLEGAGAGSSRDEK